MLAGYFQWTVYSINASNNRLTLRAQKRILKGEEVTIQYTSFMFGHLKRRAKIRACWFFDCNCQRCRDPTEFGSNMSALKCKKCSANEEEAFLLPENSIDEESSWHCRNCQNR